MQRNGVTFEEVINAANQIQSQGQNPTIERVRQHLGSGSHTTISKHLNVWREQQQTLGETESSSNWSADIVKMATEQVWSSIRKEAEEKIATIKEEARQAIQEAQQQLTIAEENESMLQRKFAELCDELNAANGAKALLDLDFKTLQQENALLSERCRGFESRLTEQSQLFARNLADKTAAYTKEAQLLEDKYTLLQNNHAVFIAELKSQYEDARHQAMIALDQAKEENKKLSKNLLNLTEKLQTKELELTETKTLLKAHHIEREDSLKLIANLPNRLDDLKTFLQCQEFAKNWKDIKEQFSALRQSSEESANTLINELKVINANVLRSRKKKKA